MKSWVRGAGARRANVLPSLNSFQLGTTARALLSSRFIVYWCDFTGSVWHRFANLSRGKNCKKCRLLQQAAFNGAFLHTWKLEFSRISTRNAPPAALNCKTPLISRLARFQSHYNAVLTGLSNAPQYLYCFCAFLHKLWCTVLLYAATTTDCFSNLNFQRCQTPMWHKL